MTMLGQHLAPVLGDGMVVIGTAFGGGSMWAHRPKEGGPAGHTEVYVEDLPPPDPRTVDALLAAAGLPLYVLDLRGVPREGLVQNGSGRRPASGRAPRPWMSTRSSPTTPSAT